MMRNIFLYEWKNKIKKTYTIKYDIKNCKCLKCKNMTKCKQKKTTANENKM